MSQSKYDLSRPYIKHGDIILFRGTGFLAKCIQYFDKAYYNHIGIVWKANNRLFILDSNEPGVKPDFLSERIRGYQDFCIVRLKWPEIIINKNVNDLMDLAQKGIKYNNARLLRIAIYLKFKRDVKNVDGGGDKNICSQFVQRYTNLFPVRCYAEDNLITPQGFIRESVSDDVIILLDDRKLA